MLNEDSRVPQPVGSADNRTLQYLVRCSDCSYGFKITAIVDKLAPQEEDMLLSFEAALQDRKF